MNYVKKLKLTLDHRNTNIDSLLLGESVIKQIRIAANLACALRITPATFTRVVNGSITESQLAADMRQRILLTENGRTTSESSAYNTSTAHKAAMRYADDDTGTGPAAGLERTAEGPKHAKTAPRDDHAERLANLEKEREGIVRDRDRNNRLNMQGKVNNDENAFDPTGPTMSNVKHFADILAKSLKTMPEAERSKKTQEVVKKLLDAANTMLYDANRHGGKKQKWGVSQKYAPMAREDINFMGDPVLEQIVLEGVVLNEFGKIGNWLRNKVGLGKKEPEPEEEEADAEPKMANNEIKERGRTPEEIAINGIIDTLKAADISTHGQTIMLQNIIKYVTKAVGTKVLDPAGRKREQIMRDYVNQMLIKQKGKPEMSMAINIGKMDKKMAAEVIETYKKVLADLGLKISDKTNNRGGVYEFVIIPKDPAAKTVGDAATMAMAKAKAGNTDKTTEYNDPNKTVSDMGDKSAKTVSDMGDEEQDADEPWMNPPKGMQIIGHFTLNGNEHDDLTVATDGRGARYWNPKKNDWMGLDVELLKSLLKGETTDGGVGLKVTKDANKPAGGGKAGPRAIGAGKQPAALGAGNGPRAIGAGNRGGLVRR